MIFGVILAIMVVPYARRRSERSHEMRDRIMRSTLILGIAIMGAQGLAFIHPASAGAEPYYPTQVHTFVRSEALPQSFSFTPNGVQDCGCGGLASLNMPQGNVALSEQGLPLATRYGGVLTVVFGESTKFRVSSPDAELTMQVDGKPFAKTFYLTEIGKTLTLDIKPGDKVDRLMVELKSSFPMVNIYADEAPIPGSIYFPQTRHNIAKVFQSYWENHGGVSVNGMAVTTSGYERNGPNIYLVQYFERVRLEYHPENTEEKYKILLGQFGYPITQEFYERLDDGVSHTVQYFERGRMEFHSENREPYMVLLGQFGRQMAAITAADRDSTSTHR